MTTVLHPTTPLPMNFLSLFRVIFAAGLFFAGIAGAGAQTLSLPVRPTSFPLQLSTNVGVVGVWGCNLQGQANVPFGLNGVAEVASGGDFVLALLTNGTVTAWGNNSSGQTNVPNGLSNVAHIAAGQGHSVALLNNGTLTAWGANDANQSVVPPGITNAVAIAAGADHTVVLKADGTVTAWGYNGYGQTSVPAGLTNVVQVAAGSEWTMALKSDGTIVAWGQNNANQCTIPPGITNVVQVAGGGTHSIALLNNGTVACWGDNTYGQCNIPSKLSGVVAVAAGYDHSVALRYDGSVVCWGLNTYGQAVTPPAQRLGLQVSAGNNHSISLLFSSFTALKQQTLPSSFPLVNTNTIGTVYCWGINTNMTNGTINISSILAEYQPSYYGSASKTFALAITGSSNILNFGNSNAPGNYSLFWNIPSGSFVSATFFNNTQYGGAIPILLGTNGSIYNAYYTYNYYVFPATPFGNGYVQLSQNYALKIDGGVDVLNFSYGTYSQPSISSASKVTINGFQISNGISQISSINGNLFMLQTNGTLVSQGSDSALSAPSCLAQVVQITTGFGFAAALRTDGSVFVWGDNSFGITNVPATATNVIQLSAGNHHIVALRSDGSVISWGDNSHGETTIPVGLSSIINVAAGDGSTYVIQGIRSNPYTFPSIITNTAVGISGQTITNDYVIIYDPIAEWVNGAFTNSLFTNLSVAVSANRNFLISVASNSSFLTALTSAITNNSSVYGVLKQGPQGIQGIQGSQGIQGPAGAAGKNGTNGATGPQGPIGPTGPQGPIGLTGPQGPQGVQGPKGDKGDTGAQGPMGLTGPQGPAGLNGTNGATGPQGAQGPAGPMGPAGSQGATGTFDPTVLTNTAFLNGLATNQAFISAMTTNSAFIAAVANQILSGSNSYGFAQKQNQTLTFPAIPAQTYSASRKTTVTLKSTSSAGLTNISYLLDNSFVGSISNTTLTILGKGTTTLTATNAGSTLYNPASATQTLIVK